MPDVAGAGDLEQREVAGEVRPDIAVRIDERMADARLRAEVDDPIDRVAGEGCVEGGHVAEVDLGEGEVAAQPGEPVALEPGIVIGVEVVDADHRLAAREQRRGDRRPDEPGDAGDEDGHAACATGGEGARTSIAATAAAMRSAARPSP